MEIYLIIKDASSRPVWRNGYDLFSIIITLRLTHHIYAHCLAPGGEKTLGHGAWLAVADGAPIDMG